MNSSEALTALGEEYENGGLSITTDEGGGMTFRTQRAATAMRVLAELGWTELGCPSRLRGILDRLRDAEALLADKAPVSQ